MSSSTSHSIKHRKKPKDVFFTPTAVANTHIGLISSNDTELWLDPFRGSGNYYSQFPTQNPKDWCEITEGKNFFDFHNKVDVICSNPPFSCIDSVLEKSIELKPRIISYLLLHGSMTPKRLERLNNAGYGLTHMYICKVYTWYGMAEAYVFEQNKDNSHCSITYDRIVHRLTDDELAKQKISAQTV